MDAWAALFQERKRAVEQQGAQYVQIVVPEKTTTLHHLIDLENSVTPLLRRLEDQVGKGDPGTFLVAPYSSHLMIQSLLGYATMPTPHRPERKRS